MYEAHPRLTQPESDDARLWRYMDFTKFVCVLDQSALYFSRADCLSDPWEGASSKHNVQLRPSVYADLVRQRAAFHREMGLPPDGVLKYMEEFNRWMKGHTFINSWHLNAAESAAMWSLYQQSGEGIAIQSTFGRLRSSLSQDPEPKVFVGLVNYIDYDSDWLPEGNTLFPFVHKRRSFEHEREVRAIVQNFASDLRTPSSDRGLSVQVDLETLIERVFVAPTAQIWIRDLVHSVAKRYGLAVDVVRSNLADDPVY